MFLASTRHPCHVTKTGFGQHEEFCRSNINVPRSQSITFDEVAAKLTLDAHDVSERSVSDRALNTLDKELLARYMALPMADKKTVRDVVTALTLARQVKP